MSKFEIWIDHQEQWDANDIDPPAAVIEASSPAHAAEEFLVEEHRTYDEEAVLIVRNEKGAFYQVTLGISKRWDLRDIVRTSLEELCAP